jgi:hypothetical protein
MSDAGVLEDIKHDLDFLKEKIIRLEITVNEIDSDIHRKVNPEYIENLDKIEKEDKRVNFKNMEEFDRHFGI